MITPLIMQGDDLSTRIMILDCLVLRNGLPIFTINLDPEKGICQKEEKFTLVSGFLQAITSFADTLDNLGEVDELQMTGLIFSFKKISLNQSELLFVISTDQGSDKIIRRILIDEISSTFLHRYEDNLSEEWNGDIHPFRDFKTIFNEITENILSNQQDLLSEYDPERTIKITQNFNLHDSDEIINNHQIKKIKSVPHQSKPSQKLSISQKGSLSPAKVGVSTRFLHYQSQKHQMAEIQRSQRVQQQIKPPKNPFQSFAKTYQSYPPISQRKGESLVSSMQFSNDFKEAALEYHAPPVPKRNGNQVFSPYYNDALYIPSISFNGKVAELPSENAKSNNVNYENLVEYNTKTESGSANIHKNIYDLIPNKRILHAGDLHKSFLTPWAQVLMVSLDGTKSIKEIANQLDLKPIEVFQICRNLEAENYIYFQKP